MTSAINQKESLCTATLTCFYHWLENKTNFKPSENTSSDTQSNNKLKPTGHLPSLSECMEFCNRQESI